MIATATFECPQCQTTHSIRPELAGTQAKCGCGNILSIPKLATRNSAPPTAPGKLQVQCPGCKKKYAPDTSLAGSAVKCTACGTAIRIPVVRSATQPANSAVTSLLDEFDEIQAEAEKTAAYESMLADDSPTKMDSGRAMRRVVNSLSAGKSSEEIIADLVKHGLPDVEAARIVENLAPSKALTPSKKVHASNHGTTTLALVLVVGLMVAVGATVLILM